MKIEQDTSGYFYSMVNGVKIILYLTDELFPDDNSLEKLGQICNTFPVHERLIGLPDLHFKIKNFVPSGMTIPLKGMFSPQLLGPNNDGMGTIKVRTSRELTNDDLTKVFNTIKKKIEMFRRQEAAIHQDELESIFKNGISEIIEDWGFQKNDLSKFEDDGCTKHISSLDEINDAFPSERPSMLPEFVPSHDIYERGLRNIGILDGTSHFIELYKKDQSINPAFEKKLDIQPHDYFFLVHAGAGDICLISHRAYLNKNDNKYNPSTTQGQKAINSFAVAGNYGFANRLFIYKTIKEILNQTLNCLQDVQLFSDCPHDYLEQKEDIFIHRKGSVKLIEASFSDQNHPWVETGTPYLFPSTVGGDAYIVSNQEGNELAFNTVSHGAGRLIKKDAAIEKYKDVDFENALQNKILLFRYGVDIIEGQNPKAFKDIDLIMQLFNNFNLAKPISKLIPIASLKA